MGPADGMGPVAGVGPAAGVRSAGGMGPVTGVELATEMGSLAADPVQSFGTWAKGEIVHFLPYTAIYLMLE